MCFRKRPLISRLERQGHKVSTEPTNPIRPLSTHFVGSYMRLNVCAASSVAADDVSTSTSEPGDNGCGKYGRPRKLSGAPRTADEDRVCRAGRCHHAGARRAVRRQHGTAPAVQTRTRRPIGYSGLRFQRRPSVGTGDTMMPHQHTVYFCPRSRARKPGARHA